MECTWDEAPSERQVLLGRVSQWRDAAEEDFEVMKSNSPSIFSKKKVNGMEGIQPETDLSFIDGCPRTLSSIP